MLAVVCSLHCSSGHCLLVIIFVCVDGSVRQVLRCISVIVVVVLYYISLLYISAISLCCLSLAVSRWWVAALLEFTVDRCRLVVSCPVGGPIN